VGSLYPGDGFGGSFNKVKSQLNRWQKAGDITNTPRPVYGGNKNASESSTRFLYKGDYIRLRDLTLGYNVPKTFLSKIKVENANIYVRGANIWTWTKDKNLPYDPETGVSSQTNLEVFIPKTYTVGIKLGF
jgi:TonB-dependent starch-binding outer membrane protein SusC